MLTVRARQPVVYLVLGLISSRVLSLRAAEEERTTNSTATTKGPISVVLGDFNSNACPDNYERISDSRMCVAAMDILGPGNGHPLNFSGAYPADMFTDVDNRAEYPKGCYRWDLEHGGTRMEGAVAFNEHPTGTAPEEGYEMWPICARNLEPPRLGETLYMGDSLVDYWTNRPASIFGYNVGVGNTTCRDVLETVDSYLDYFRPATVVLACGELDLASETSVSETTQRLSGIVQKINTMNASVIYMGTRNTPGTRSLLGAYSRYDNSARAIAEANCRDAAGQRRPPFTFIDVNAGFGDLGNPDSLYGTDVVYDDPGGVGADWYAHHLSDQLLSEEAYGLWSDWVAAAHSDSTCCVWKGDECVYDTASFGAAASKQSFRWYCFVAPIVTAMIYTHISILE